MPDHLPRSPLNAPAFLRLIAQLSAASDRIWLLALGTGLCCTLIAAYLFAGSPSGKFWAYAALMVRASLYLWSGDALRGRGGEVIGGLFGVGMVAGCFELLVDWGLIHWIDNGRLIYLSGNDVVLLGSPVWMPLAWACVVVELGYPSLRLFGIFRPRMSAARAGMLAAMATGAAAMITVGFYEFFAYRAGWWRYERAHLMLGDFCALFIPLGEFFMFLALLPIAARCFAREDRKISSRIEGGVLFAVAIALGYTLSYLLLEAGRIP